MGTTHARTLVHHGAKVVGFDISDANMLELIEELGTENFVFLRGNVTSIRDWENVVNACQRFFGNPNILVNNAGILGLHYLTTVSEAEYQRVINVNQIGVFLGMKTVVDAMRDAGGGSIINICSTSGIVAFEGNFSYVASKWAVRGMTKAAALELAQHSIRVNTICPGETDTPLIKTDPTASPPERLPFGRWAKPQEISDAVLYLASDLSSYVTGTDLVVDGAYTAS